MCKVELSSAYSRPKDYKSDATRASRTDWTSVAKISNAQSEPWDKLLGTETLSPAQSQTDDNDGVQRTEQLSKSGRGGLSGGARVCASERLPTRKLTPDDLVRGFTMTTSSAGSPSRRT